MESQMIRSHDYNQEQESPFVGEPQGEEKKSVLKKVKDKAKKIKETIKKHGHGGDGDHDGGQESDEMKTPPDDHDLNEEDTIEEDEATADLAAHGPPETHEAPMYESGAATAARTSQPEEMSRPGVTIERLARGDEEVKSAFPGGGEEKREVNLGKTRVLGELPGTPQNTPVQSSNRQAATFVPGAEESPEQRKVNLERPRGLEEDPAAPKVDADNTKSTTNYQTKVTDPTGEGEELKEISPMTESFGKLGMTDEQKRGEKQGVTRDLPFPTGSHDQFQSHPEQSLPEPLLSAEPVMEKMDTSESQEDQPPTQGGYISTAASTISSKATDLGAGLMSKVGGSGTVTKTGTVGPEIGADGQKGESAKQSSVAEAMKNKIAPVYEKAAGAGTAVLSKVVGSSTGTNQGPGERETGAERDQNMDGGSKQFSVFSIVKGKAAGAGSAVMSKIRGTGEETSGEGEIGQDKGVSVSSYLSEKLKPGEEDKALSEVISEKLMRKREEPDEKDRSQQEAGEGSRGMVDKLKGAAGSWFGKSQESPRTRQTNGSGPHIHEVEGVGKEEKKLQESSN